MTEAVHNRLSKLVHSAPILLFMKGTPDEPKCGFSRKMVALLRPAVAHFDTFNILDDSEVREGLKVFSNWPTFPQLYVNGKLVGGLDVCEQLQEAGELADVLAVAAVPLEERLKQLTNAAPVMLFMKGSPDAPQCGFSSKIVSILQREKVAFQSFDILQDDAVRQGLKKFSNWPTFPQLYSNGKLVGGVDIVEELAQGGELLSALE